jgi:DNA-directed RNA polymerase specialized sigma subunit
MRALRLTKTELEEVCHIMSIGNTALKECAEMMDMKHREFRGKLFNGKLDTSKLTADQLEKLEVAKPLIFAVRDQCQEKVRANYKRMVAKQAWFAARNNYDPVNAREEFMQEGDIAVLDGLYGYVERNIKLTTYMWQCIRRRIFDAINHLNPLCPLTNEAIDLVCRVQEIHSSNSELSDEQAAEVLGFSSEETKMFFRSITKVLNQSSEDNQREHSDDYTASRRGVDRDHKEAFFIRKDARQAVKDADLNDFELSCVFGDTFPYHGWKEDVASKHINPQTGKRFTRQNIQHVLERAKNKIRETYLHPPKVHLDNPIVDKFFDEWSAENAVMEDQQRK